MCLRARDFQAFLVFSHHHVWISYASKALENAVYNKLIFGNVAFYSSGLTYVENEINLLLDPSSFMQ